MLQKTKNFFLISCLSIMIYSCSGAQDVIQGKKRSDSNDEFLVEKKNPLMMPPDYEDLPMPVDNESSGYKDSVNESDSELIKLIQSENENNIKEVDTNSNLEKSIIEKISK